MFSKSMALRIISAVVMMVILAGCSSPTPTPAATSVPQPTANLQPTLIAAQTQAVQTFVANLTQNAPTATKIVPTNTPMPTATQAPSATPAKPANTVAPTAKPQASGPTATAPIFCSISSVLVNGGSDAVSASDSLKFTWVVVNTGPTTWTASDFYLAYWSGVRFPNQVKVSLPFDVGTGSNMTIPTNPMTAPSSSGTYRAVWAIIKGFQPYCLLPVTVVVK
jgi:hypothetical protein